MKQEEYPLLGLHCAACVARVEQKLSSIDGIEEVRINLASNSLHIRYDDTILHIDTLAQTIEELGYQLWIKDPRDNVETLEQRRLQEERQNLRHCLGAGLSSLMLMLLMPYAHLWSVSICSALLSGLALALFGRAFYQKAYLQLRQRSWGMDVLIALSTSTAYLYSLGLSIAQAHKEVAPHSYYEASVMIIAFILLGKYIEARAKGKTLSAIKELINLQPKEVLRIHTDGQSQLIPITQLRIGDDVLIRAGERIPLDGTICQGESYIDESMLTGEAIPILRSVGDTVFAGSLNQLGSLTVRCNALPQDSLLAKIIRRVSQAQGSKSPIQTQVDRIASIFVPSIVTLAALTLFVWLIAGGWAMWEQGLISAVSVLVIACPCALGLAVPTAIVVAIGRAAQKGILIKDAQSLELARHIDTLAFDKTGTLTQGQLNILSWDWLDKDLPQEHIKSLLKSIEERSEHPIAQTITHELSHYPSLSLEQWHYLPGLGIKAELEGESYLVGHREFMAQHNIDLSSIPAEDVLTGVRRVYMACGEKLCLCLSLADQIKAGSQSLINELRQSGISLHLLSGDRDMAVKQIAQELGIEHYQAELSPEGKADAIRRLSTEGHRVAMIGDGINDSVALAEAELSVAMANGSDIAIETAQVSLLRGDISLLPKLIKLSHLSQHCIRQNLFWAFVYNVCAIPIASGVFYHSFGLELSPSIASLAMVSSSLSVVFNSLRLYIRLRKL